MNILQEIPFLKCKEEKLKPNCEGCLNWPLPMRQPTSCTAEPFGSGVSHVPALQREKIWLCERQWKFDGGGVFYNNKSNDLYMNLGAWDFDRLWCLDICLSIDLGIQDVWTPKWCLNQRVLTKKPSQDQLRDTLKPSGGRPSPFSFRHLKVVQHLKIRQS